MVVPIVVLVAIPVFLGIVYMPPFDMPIEEEPKEIPEESDFNILYYMFFQTFEYDYYKVHTKIKLYYYLASYIYYQVYDM